MSDINWGPLVIIICLWVAAMGVLAVLAWRLRREEKELDRRWDKVMGGPGQKGEDGHRYNPKQYRKSR